MKRKISKELLTAYVLGELPKEERANVADLIKNHDTARRAAADIKATVELTEAAFENAAAAAPGLTEAQRGKVREQADKKGSAWIFETQGGIFDEPSSAAAKSPFDISGGLFANTVQAETANEVKDGSRQDVMTSAPTDESPRRPTMESARGSRPGTRNDDSVLFSLNKLRVAAQTTATAPSSVVDSSESSGLIDIRSLAHLHTVDASDSDEIGHVSASLGFGAPLAPVLASTETRRSWVKPAIAAGVALTLMTAGTVAVLLGGRNESSDTAKRIAALQAQIAELNKRKDRGDTEGIEKLESLIATLERESRGEEEDAEEVATVAMAKKQPAPKQPAKAAKGGRSYGAPKSTSPSKSSSSSSSSPPSSASVHPKPKPSNDLDDLLGSASSSRRTVKSAGPSTGSSSESGPKSKLSRTDVQNGMQRVAGGVERCRQGEGGTITLSVQIDTSGRVTSASPIGPFAGTPVGACAARAVRRARFPASKQTLTVKYPFTL